MPRVSKGNARPPVNGADGATVATRDTDAAGKSRWTGRVAKAVRPCAAGIDVTVLLRDRFRQNNPEA